MNGARSGAYLLEAAPTTTSRSKSVQCRLEPTARAPFTFQPCSGSTGVQCKARVRLSSIPSCAPLMGNALDGERYPVQPLLKPVHRKRLMSSHFKRAPNVLKTRKLAVRC